MNAAGGGSGALGVSLPPPHVENFSLSRGVRRLPGLRDSPSTDHLRVKTFATERAALEWADRFAYSRQVCRLRPLVVSQLPGTEGFGVFNPDYPVDTYKLTQSGRVVRMGSVFDD